MPNPDQTGDPPAQRVEERPPPADRTFVSRRERVPFRTILATVGVVLATAAILLLAWEVRRILTWIVVSALLAVILGPLVDVVERRLHVRRALATLLVFLAVLLAVAGLLAAFIRPLVKEGGQLADKAPAYVEQARSGRGPVGALIKRYKVEQYVQRNQSKIREFGNRITSPALAVLRSIASTVIALVTVIVLTFLMVMQGPKLLVAWTEALPERRRERVRRVAADSSRAVVGYMTGNLLISVIAGLLTFVVLWILGVPYKGVVALFVGFADLIPLVGATLGAVVAIIVAALHSLVAAIVVLAFFILYQQFENHVLQPVIMSRTVQLSALTVLVSVLLGVELLGFLGALLAIPVAGIIHVISRDLWDGYRGRPKAEPTVGADEIPASSPRAPTEDRGR
jgi:predicted PurR-regulated permease PerM